MYSMARPSFSRAWPWSIEGRRRIAWLDDLSRREAGCSDSVWTIICPNGLEDGVVDIETPLFRCSIGSIAPEIRASLAIFIGWGTEFLGGYRLRRRRADFADSMQCSTYGLSSVHKWFIGPLPEPISTADRRAAAT